MKDVEHSLSRPHSRIVTRRVVLTGVFVCLLCFLLIAHVLTGTEVGGDGHSKVEQTRLPDTANAKETQPSATPAATGTTTTEPHQTSPAPTATRAPLTGLPEGLERWGTYTIPEDWMECIRRNLQLDERGRPLHAVTEMEDAIPLLITPLTGDVRFFPYFICSVDVPVRYHLVIQNERDPETVAAIDELQRRFGDSGRLLVVRNRYNRGYSGSMNQGFEWALRERTMAEVPWVFACGVDTIFEKGLLANLVGVVRNNTRGDAAMLELLKEEVAMEERLVREGNLSYYEKWAPRGRPLKVLRSGFPGVPLNVRTAPLLPDRVRYTIADENRESGLFTPEEMRARFFSGYVASVTPVPSALGTIVFTRLALSTVGVFDENYFPAYMDDIDIRWRQFAYGFSAIHAERNHPVRRWHHYNAPNLRGGGPFSDPDLEKYGTEDNYSRRAFRGYLERSYGLYDRVKHGPRDFDAMWRQSVEKGEYNYTRFNVSKYPADVWVLDETVHECMFRHTYNYTKGRWMRPWDCGYKPETLEASGVLGIDQLASYKAVVAAKRYMPE